MLNFLNLKLNEIPHFKIKFIEKFFRYFFSLVELHYSKTKAINVFPYGYEKSHDNSYNNAKRLHFLFPGDCLNFDIRTYGEQSGDQMSNISIEPTD